MGETRVWRACRLTLSRPTHSDMPEQWEARRTAFDPNHRPYHNHTSDYRIYGRYSYDGVNLRKAHFDYASFGDEPTER